MDEAARVAVNGTPFPCDVGGFNGDTFVYVAAFGLFTEVSYQTSQQMKNILGHAAYILEGAKHLMDITSYRMKVSHDGEIIEDEFIYGMVTNSLSVGGFKGISGPDVLLDDGLFEVTLIKNPKIQSSSTRYLLDWQTVKMTMSSSTPSRPVSCMWRVRRRYRGHLTESLAAATPI